MPEAADLRNAVIAWAEQFGVIADSAPRADDEADPSVLPFSHEHAEYFRTRKITRVTASRRGRPTVTIFSRLPIAKKKSAELLALFAEAFDARVRLLLDVSSPFKVDHAVQEYGRFEPILRHEGRICCGSSVGLGNQRNAGTLTALATSKDKALAGNVYGLSCNHVVGGCSTARPGTPIVVPGIQDVSAVHNEITVIGDHISTARMSQGLPAVSRIDLNRDLAFFAVRDPDLLTSLQGTDEDAYDTPTKIARPSANMLVKKWGRSTGLTRGKIASVLTEPEPIEYNVVSYYGPMNSQKFKGTVYFGELYEVQSTGSPFSLGGDSGALVVTDEPEPRAIGLVVAGERSSKSLVLPLRPALKDLKLQLLSGHNT